jgi:hypothetical protein
MKSCAILIHLKAIALTEYISLEQLNDYIDISLKPYNELGIFAYKAPSRNIDSIWGMKNQSEFISVFKSVLERPLISCKSLTGDLEKININFEKPLSKQYPAAINEALCLLCGLFTFESGFYDCQKKTCILNSDDIKQIEEHADEYVLSFIDLYR